MFTAAWLLAAGAASAAAHPLGNFVVNRYARIEPRPRSMALLYVVDFAEIPSAEELARFPRLAAQPLEELERSPEAAALRDRLAEEWTSGLRLDAEGSALALRRTASTLEVVPGAGGLPTLRLRLIFEGPWPTGPEARVTYDDTNAPGRLGWREIVVKAAPGVDLRSSSGRFADRSDELTDYPTDPAAEVPYEVHAELQVRGIVAGAVDDSPIPAASRKLRAAFGLDGDRFVGLLQDVRKGRPSLSVMLTALLVAAGLGAAHALSPGHGKTIVGAYLVGTRGTAAQALLLGAVVTVAHTAGVFLLGLVTLGAAQFILPERLYPWLGFVSGALVALIGAGLFHQRLELALGVTGEHRHWFWAHAHVVPAHAREDGQATETRVRSLVALGISGGLVPCPSAIVVLLSAVALHQIAFGLVLILAFSAGLAAVLMAIGLLFVHASRWLAHFDDRGPVVRALPVLSALAVTILGVAIAVQALLTSGIVLGPRPSP